MPESVKNDGYQPITFDAIKIGLASPYQTADNPILEVFYLENAHGLIADFSGNPPYEF